MSIGQETKTLTYMESVQILSKYDIPVARGDLAGSPEEAARIAVSLGYPVALKVISSQVSHKTEAKGVQLDVKTESDLVRSYHELTENVMRYDPSADIAGVLVQEMAKGGTEVIVGLSRDPQFGPVILFGLGGIFVEVLKDASLRFPPIGRSEATEMIKELKGHEILEGFRGRPRADTEAVVDILLKVSRLSTELKESVLEMDLNPIMVQPEGKGAKVIDARFVVSDAAGVLSVKGGR